MGEKNIRIKDFWYKQHNMESKQTMTRPQYDMSS